MKSIIKFIENVEGCIDSNDYMLIPWMLWMLVGWPLYIFVYISEELERGGK